MKARYKKAKKRWQAVNGKVGDRWSWATFLYVTCQFNYVAILLIGGIIIRNTIGVHKFFLTGIGIARPLIKPGIIILGVHYVWSDVIKVGGVGLVLTGLFIFGTAITVMYICKKLVTFKSVYMVSNLIKTRSLSMVKVHQQKPGERDRDGTRNTYNTSISSCNR